MKRAVALLGEAEVDQILAQEGKIEVRKTVNMDVSPAGRGIQELHSGLGLHLLAKET